MSAQSSSISPTAPPPVLDLSVVIVNYNVREFLEQALRSVRRAADGLEVEVFVVDNNSVDGSVAMVRSAFPEVKVIANAENAGFGRANNQALREAQGQYLLILNPDTIVQEDTFSALIRFMDAHPDAGAVGYRILNPDGSFAPESRRAFPTPGVAFYRMIGLSRLFPKSRRFGRYNLTYVPNDAVTEVDALSGSCMLVRRAALYHSHEDWDRRDDDAELLQIALDSGAFLRGGQALRGDHEMVGNTEYQKAPSPQPPAPSLRRDDEVDGDGQNHRVPALGHEPHAASPRPSATSHEPRTDSQQPVASSRQPSGAGLFDESFFMYGEYLDWCFRIQQAGWKIYYTPETQIIHYKGESTKKGELQYVRHFYGAMRLFTQKHFQDRYSLLFAGMLHAGISFRACLSMVTRSVRRMSLPLIDGVLVYGIVAMLGYGRAILRGADPAGLFFATVAPGFALGAVLGIALTGGYRPERRRRLQPIVAGAVLGLLGVASLSFFVKDIAFSRIVVSLSFPSVVLFLSGCRRLIYRRPEPRRAVLVGSPGEAERLRGMLAARSQPPFELVGFVTPDALRKTSGLPCLGTLHHLRDLVRLRGYNEVIFAEDGLSHRTVFRLMRQLHDLPVQFRILSQGRDQIIGKASIDDLAAPPLREVATVVGRPRPRTARRAFEVPLALVGVILHPAIALSARVAGRHSYAAWMARRTRGMVGVLRNERALVGYRTDDPYRPPDEWGLQPGVFSIVDALGADTTGIKELNRAYWFYVSHQSASLDWSILVRSLRNGYH